MIKEEQRFAVVIGVMTTIIGNIDRAGKDYQDRVEKVEEYMAFVHLPNELRYLIRDYYLHKFKEGKVFDETEIVCDLSPQLKSEV